jgi:hypothetical protein
VPGAGDHGNIEVVAWQMRTANGNSRQAVQVPARDAQLILGYSRMAITLEIYTHEARDAHRQALTQLSQSLRQGWRCEHLQTRTGVKGRCHPAS